MREYFRQLSLPVSALYVALLLLGLAMLCSCQAAPQVISDAVQAELIRAGFTPEQAAVVGQVVMKTAQDMAPDVPTWVHGIIDVGILALFPAMAVVRNRSRTAQFAALKQEVVAEVKAPA